MKTKFVFALFLLVWTSKTTHAQTIPNSSFENWTIDSTDKDFHILQPDGWSTLNFGMNTPDAISPSMDFKTGKLSARIAGGDLLGSSIPGIMFYEDAISSTSNYLNGYYKSDFTLGDTFIITVNFYNSKTKQGYEVSQFASKSQLNWTPFNVKLDVPLGLQPDSIFVSIMFWGDQNSYGLLDDLQFESTPLGSAFGNSFASSNLIKSYENIEVTLFPNPANQLININFINVKPGKAEISISDINGKIVNSEQLDISTFGLQAISINTINLESGMYFCTIKTNESIINKKFSIKR